MRKSQKNFLKNANKIFSGIGNPRGNALLPLYIVEMLVLAGERKQTPVTVQQLQKMLIQERKVFYSVSGIQATINNIHCFCPALRLQHTKVHAVKNKAFAFSILNNGTACSEV